MYSAIGRLVATKKRTANFILQGHLLRFFGDTDPSLPDGYCVDNEARQTPENIKDRGRTGKTNLTQRCSD